MEMIVYVISGLGADYKVLERLEFPEGFTVQFIPWLMPQRNETFESYTSRMAENIDDSKPFVLLGYSFGGILVQEIHRIKPAVKVIILASLRSGKEKSVLLKVGSYTGITRLIPEGLFKNESNYLYRYFRKLIASDHPRLNEYFTQRDPYYLKWSVENISRWNADPQDKVIQIMGDKDQVFPIKNCRPDFVIQGGTHLFPATKSREVNKILFSVLQKCKTLRI